MTLFKSVYLLGIVLAVILWSSGMLESHFRTWDAQYYLLLSRRGYVQGMETCAFYPLFPLIVRWVAKLSNVNLLLVGMILANLFSLAAFILFYRYVHQRYGQTIAVWTMALLLAFPGSLFYQFIYTESLFFLLLMLLCTALETGNRPMAMIAAFLLPLTRALGFLCVFPIAWELLAWSRPDWWRRMSARPGWIGWIARWVAPRNQTMWNSESLQVDAAWRVHQRPSALVVVTPLLGWALYFMLMQRWTGNPFEGIEAQKQFGVQSIEHLFQPMRFVKLFFAPTAWHEFHGSVLDRCVFVLMLYSFPLVWKLDKSWCMWMFLLGVVPAASGGFSSYTRFASVVFPFFVALAVFLNKQGSVWHWARWGVLTAFATLHVVLVWKFVNGGWAG